ncbi:hypothetical protein Fmac_007929 [Flemingia macrophylla]|uniref:Uncharacterized protein n=1 Tax=Flemingia macrophylla TaxID=520843 RepID=A0ABD1MW09_9FABA
MSNYPDSSISTSRVIMPNTGAVTKERPNSSSVVDSKGIEDQVYYLKNGDDVPPFPTECQ